MKKEILAIFVGGLLLVNVSAQEAVVPGGGYHQGNGVSISWTLGELAIETFVAGNKILTQGFQQPDVILVSVVNPGEKSPNIIAYPNPASDYLYIGIMSDFTENLSLHIYDSTGRLLVRDKIDSPLWEIPFHAYEPGLYVVRIYLDTQPVKDFKIMKKR